MVITRSTGVTGWIRIDLRPIDRDEPDSRRYPKLFAMLSGTLKFLRGRRTNVVESIDLDLQKDLSFLFLIYLSRLLVCIVVFARLLFSEVVSLYYYKQ